MSLAEELALKYAGHLNEIDGFAYGALLAAINEAIERCAWQLEIAVPGQCQTGERAHPGAQVLALWRA